MVKKISIENGKNLANLATVGSQIVRWAGGRSVETAFKTTEIAFGIANRGLGRAGRRGKQLAAEARNATVDRTELVKTRAREEYLTSVEATVGVLETTSSQEVVKTIREVQGKAAWKYANFLIDNDEPTDLQTWRMVTDQLMQSEYDIEEIDHIHNNLKVIAPIGDIVSAENGLENFVGTFDPSLTGDGLARVVDLSRIPHQ